MTTPPETHFRLRDTELSWKEVEGELIALDLVRSRYFAVNRTGRILWETLQQGATHAELVEKLIQACGVGRERATADVDGFLAELESNGLIVPGTTPGEPHGGSR